MPKTLNSKLIKPLSQAAEDCLLLIHRLTERGEEITTSGLARGLRLSDPTVTVMIQKLAQRKLLHYVPRRKTSLTGTGAELARRLIRRHRLVEAYLHERLGYSWEEVHGEAERIEHAVSEKFVEAIDRALSYPKFDPHGDPIPDAHGQSAPRKLRKLSALAAGEGGLIARIIDGKPDVLVYLSALGLTLGARIMIREVPKYDALVHLSVDDRSVTLSAAMAANILIE